MFSSRPFRGSGMGGAGGGLTGQVPQDLWILLGIVLGTFALQFFDSTAWLPALLRLTPSVWQAGFIWQLVTYPFIGAGVPGIWFIVSLLILFLFGRDVLLQLGRRRFWTLIVLAAGVAAVVAILVGLLQTALGGGHPTRMPFPIMQGQNMLLVILIAAFATLKGHATIYLFFVLPVQARWFLLLEILFAFMGFLSTGDLAGFLGICAAVVFTFRHLSARTGDRWSRELWLQTQQIWLRLRLSWLKRKRGFQVLKGGDKGGPKDPWIH